MADFKQRQSPPYLESHSIVGVDWLGCQLFSTQNHCLIQQTTALLSECSWPLQDVWARQPSKHPLVATTVSEPKYLS